MVTDAIEPVDTSVPSDTDDVGAEDHDPTDTARDEGQDADVGQDDPGPQDVKVDGVGDNGGKDLNICVPNCGALECGPDPVCQTECGPCDGGKTCKQGKCEECVPNCDGLQCGLDPICQTECGPCDGGKTCKEGKCEECVPNCGALECGPDPVCQTECGPCDGGKTCKEGKCEECVPNCDGLQCGLDPICQTECGPCDGGKTCKEGKCEGECVPDCGELECGLDPNCKTECGPCDDGKTCLEGICCTIFFKDEDRDGYGGDETDCLPTATALFSATKGGDCCDTDDKVNPESTSPQIIKNKCDSWDYNCDGKTSFQYNYGVGICNDRPCNSSMVAGWWGNAPACGKSGTFLNDCYNYWGTCKAVTTDITQGCY